MYKYILLFLLINITSVQAFEKQALVFGNGDYYGRWQLTNPVNDAEDVADALRNLGFNVTWLTNQSNRGMSDAVQRFARGLENGDVALFYFSGHGFSGKDVNNRDTNFLVGSFSNAVSTKAALEEESIDANFVVKSLRQSNPQGTNIMVLDACRDVPPDFLEEQKGLFDEGLVSLGKYERFIMNYATQPSKRALGSKNNRNSLYTQYLVEGLKDSQLTAKNITEFFNDVGLKMVTDFGDKQVPLVESPPVQFCLAGCSDLANKDAELTEIRKRLKEMEDKLMIAMSGMTSMESVKPPIEPIEEGKSFRDCPDCPEMVWIPAGTFEMGSNDGNDDEKPVHTVSIKGFAMGKYEVTFEEYDQFCEATGRDKPDDEGWGRGSRPVINVSWNDAKAYTRWLSEKTGKAYRLPTEAEWEYACRAGSSGKYSFGDDVSRLGDYAWYGDNSGSKTHPVGGKQPNAFGLYDIHGNVWEWNEDVWHEDYARAPTDSSAWMSGGDSNYHLLRGGSWFNLVNWLRCAYRAWNVTTGGDNCWGFRLSRM